MVADAAKLVRIIKQTAMDAVMADKPVEVCVGKVMCEEPLQILVEQKLLLGEKQLVLTKAVTDHWVDIEVSHYTVNDAFMNPDHIHYVPEHFVYTDEGNLDTTHKHAYKGRKKIKIYNGLKLGENVLLIRFDRGQRFVVLDRVSEHITKGEWI